ncbi:DUF2062 domain-containing protein [Rossellomorea vietnamensis]|uniref:DUF2062 domain-containing protein n=1 Tax=Rossellomorea vietnamensis TaxID=218284 RepID=A0ACD4C9X2_9BACI|nr:DUF2062 domain-containing protein [Rossellomorea vietnamensis]UXH45219.1 DUF2062 domain-containing protein [Rossellomorea vietnamensis]WQI96575.1 DUF2062 domain-containing protein [Rossellomorea vietnamensis]
MIRKKLRELKCLTLKLLRLKDNAHSIALGFTVGLLINFVPSFGIGPVISTASAKIFKGNPFAGLVGGVSLIWAFPFFFYLNLVVGHLFFPLDSSGDAVGVGLQIGKAFFTGMMINIPLFGILIYAIMNSAVKKYRGTLLTFVQRKWNV